MSAAGAVARRDRLVVLASAALACALAWAALVAHGGGAAGGAHAVHAGHALAPHALAPSWSGFAATFLMWFLMMVAMMLPAVAPWIVLFAELDRRQAQHAPHVPAALFAAGYFAVWAGYSLLAAAVQLGLQQAANLDRNLALGAFAGGILLVLAGAFQFTPLKAACLTHCRNPLSYLIARWRDGPVGAFGLGARHGLFCTGCCWALMALGFALGVMNLAWMAALTVAIAVEKNAPGGAAWSRVMGAGLAGWGVWLIAAAARG